MHPLVTGGQGFTAKFPPSFSPIAAATPENPLFFRMQAKKLQEALGQLGGGPAALGYPAGALRCCELLGSYVHTLTATLLPVVSRPEAARRFWCNPHFGGPSSCAA